MSFIQVSKFLRRALIGAGIVILVSPARAATYFVQEALHDAEVSATEANAATALVRDAVSRRPGDLVVQDEERAQFSLQPRLMRLGEAYVLTVEKFRGRETVFAAQSKLSSIEDLDQAANTAVRTAIEERKYQPAKSRRGRTLGLNMVEDEEENGSAPYHHDGTISGATQSAAATAVTRAVEVLPAKQNKMNQWLVGFGPFLSRKLGSDRAMYEVFGGHKWNLNPRAALKATGEAAFSSSRDQAQFLNLALGGHYYIPGDEETAPYLTTDMGYGFAQNADGFRAEGFSLGLGVGYEFFRTTATTLDLLLRYATIFDNTTPESGNPAILGLRVAVGF